MIDREDIYIIETMARSDASNEALGRVVRAITIGLSASPSTPASAPAPAPQTTERVIPAEATRKSHRRDASDATRYLDGPVRAAMLASSATIVGTTRELVARFPWPYSETTPAAGRSLGSKLGFMIATKTATPGGVYVVATEVMSPHGEKNAVRYTLGLLKGS